VNVGLASGCTPGVLVTGLAVIARAGVGLAAESLSGVGETTPTSMLLQDDTNKVSSTTMNKRDFFICV